RSYGDWSSDVCSSDLASPNRQLASVHHLAGNIGQAVGTALGGAALVVLAAGSQHCVDGRLEPGPALGVQETLQLQAAVQELSHEIGRASCRERGLVAV